MRAPVVMLAAVLAVANETAAQPVQTFDVTPVTTPYRYQITTDTSVVEPSLVIENVGGDPVTGVRLVANGHDLSSIDRILAGVVRPGQTPEQQARAIWQFAREHYFPWNTYSDFATEASDPVRFFSSYGYGLCGDVAQALAALYVRAGFPTRIWSIGWPSGHVVPEVFFDGGWHVMDANRGELFLRRDNRTIASVDDLVADPGLIGRAGPATADLQTLYATTPPGSFADVTSVSASVLAYDLRPGERLEFLAVPLGLYRQDTATATPAPLRYGNAVLSTSPSAATQSAGAVFEPGHGMTTVVNGTERWWAPADPAASPRYRVSTPHPLLASTLRLTGRLDAGARIQVFAAKGTAGLELSAGDLASGAFDDPAVVSHEGLAWIEQDGSFPVLHAGPSGSGALGLRTERLDAVTPLVVRGTLFRYTELDGLAIDVSLDGLTWTTLWQPTPAQVGYFDVAADATAAVGNAPVVFVRYRFEARSGGGWAAGAWALAVSGVVPSATTLVGTLIPTEAATQEFDLTPIVAPGRGAASYGYTLRFAFEGGAGLTAFETANVMQTSPVALPSPARGTTAFELDVAQGDPTSLRIRHAWSPRDVPVPLAPIAPLAPGNGESLPIGDPMTFSWVPSADFPVAELQQYEVEICADASCVSPVSTATEVETAPWLPGPDGQLGTADDEQGVSTAPMAQLNLANWLESGRTYYWRVRAHGAVEWGPYSETWSFVAAPRATTTLHLQVDQAGQQQVTTPLAQISGSVSGNDTAVEVRWTSSSGQSGRVTTVGPWQADVPLGGGLNEITLVAVDGTGQTSTARVAFTVPYYSYYLAEGSTLGDFTTDLAIANPTALDADVEVHFLLDTGSTVVRSMTVPALRRITVAAVDEVGPGVSFAVEVRSLDAVTLAVERTMRWGPHGASGHSGAAVTRLSATWYFAEGAQGVFDTFVLLANPGASDLVAQVVFMTEDGATVAHALAVPARSRETVWTRQFPQLQNRSFSITVQGSAPLITERAVYFGSPVWTGGHVSPGADALATRWSCPEGATGPFLDTYVLVGNPSSSVSAPITVEYFTGTGDVVTEQLTVKPHSRLTIDVESRDSALIDAAVSTVITSESPVVVERATYWGGHFTEWRDGHSSMGTVAAGHAWAVADVRVGGGDAYETWLLLTNENADPMEVEVTVLPESGQATTRTISVPARSRYNYYINAELPELAGQRVGMRLASTHDQHFAVERSQYWSVNGVTWSGGTSSRATMLP